MSHWVWLLLICGILLISYLAFFFLSSLLTRGSPLYITASYYTKAFLRQIFSIGPGLRELIRKPPSDKTLTPQETFAKAEAARPVTVPPIPMAEPEKQPAAPKKVRKPDTRPGFAGLTHEPFSSAVAREVVREQRRVWVRYRHENGVVSEDKLEIYNVSGPVFRAWCCAERDRDILRLNGVIAWHVLDERFERTPILEQWAGKPTRFAMPEWIAKWLRPRHRRSERDID